MRRQVKITALVLTAVMAFSMPVIPNRKVSAGSTPVKIDEEHFPDEGFREYVFYNYDVDRNWSLDKQEIEAATVLDVRSRKDIKSLTGISYLTSLYDVDTCDTIIGELDLSKNTDVHSIDASDSKLRKLDITGLSDLAYLNVEDTKLTFIDISSNPVLLAAYSCPEAGGVDNTNYDCKLFFPTGIQVFTDHSKPTPTVKPTPVPSYRQANTSAGEVQIDSKNFPDAILREYVEDNFDDDNDSVLSVQELSEATRIRIFDGVKSAKGIELLPNLKELPIEYCQLTSINLNACRSLESARLDNNDLKKVDVTGCPTLVCLSVAYNPNLTELNLGNSRITYLCCQGTKLTTLDISGCSGLAEWKSGQKYIDSESITVSGAEIYFCYDKTLNVIQNGSSVLPVYQVTATPTPKPTTSGGGSGSGSGNTVTTESGIEGFVERLYTVALGRESDPHGKADWINRVRVGGNTGADLARGFLFSDEFLSKNMSNSNFVDVLYATFFNRQADEHKADWLGLIDSGWTKTQVIDGFINSTEWANLCLTFGIASGSTFKPNITVAPSQDVINFATRLYTTCLGRNADQGGLDNWANQLANMQISGSEAAHGFFFSDEFINAGISDSEYVMRLYRTFMGREYDQGGYDNWMAALASGQSREFVFQGFAGSAEWAGICADYGILK